MTEGTQMISLLQQLLVPGTLGTVVGVILSYAIEWWPEFDQAAPKKKRLLFFGMGLLLSVVAGVCIAAITGEWDGLDIIANAIVVTIASMTAGTMAHTRELPG